ncbi:MAG: nitrate reductase molybdenum cofactor assembly chaperone [Terriglobales bacterium]
MPTSIYERLAAVLTYPDEDYHGRVLECVAVAKSTAGHELRKFIEKTAALSVAQLQELFAVTFELNLEGSLEAGWHLYGEDGRRAALLVRLREQMRLHGVDETKELPDHLTNVLPLLARLEHTAAAELVGTCVQPALRKMLAATTGKANPYEHLLAAVAAVLQTDFPELSRKVEAASPGRAARRAAT